MMGGHLNRALSWGIAMAWPEFEEFTDAKGKKDFKILEEQQKHSFSCRGGLLSCQRKLYY